MNKKENKREAAKSLYMEGFTQDDIATIISVAPNTITRWKQDDNWSEQRIQRLLSDQSTADGVREIINYQIDVLRIKKDEQMLLPKGERKLILAGDIDGLTKLFSTIKKDEIKFEAYIAITRKLLIFIVNEDLHLGKQIEPLFDRFINEMRKVLK
jgi:predicted transcriptional regulator